MKKIKVLVLVCSILLLIPATAEAQTIQGYRQKIKELEKEKSEAEDKSAETDAKIKAAEDRIAEITRQIVQARKDQEDLQKEIDELNKEIKEKEKQIKDLVAFYQISEGDNFYLKYIFGADSFEDFIYRFSVAEQLTDANDKLIDEMNDLIAKNKKKMQELKDQEKRLDNLNGQIAKEIEKLGNQKKKFTENALSVDEEIKTIEDQISYYKSKGCSETEDVIVCSRPSASSYGQASSSADNLIPSARGFILPLPYGYITSYYGGRIHPIFGTASYHSGVDIAASTGTTIMASNKGVVVGSDWYDGYGNAVLVYHESCDCTTLYGHMSVRSVSVGQGVSRGQKIGEVGSTGWSTGPHLHFQAMYGYGYNLGSTFDPFNLVYIPLSW